MRIAEYKQVSMRTEQRIVYHDEIRDDNGNLVSGAWDETVEVEVPVMDMVYRDMTPEEEAEYNNSIQNVVQEPTQEDRIEAQVLYTALMTDTLLEE